MKLPFGMNQIRPWVLGLVLGYSWPALADALLDFTMFNPPTTEQRKIKDPVMTWLVQPDPKSFCEKASPKDGYFVRPEGCVYWQVQSSSCTIVTTSHTTHSQLGHLFVRCMQAQ